MNFSTKAVSQVFDFGNRRMYATPEKLARMSLLPHLVTRAMSGEFFDSEFIAKLTINASVQQAGDPDILDIQLSRGLDHLTKIAGPALANLASPSLFWGFTVDSNPELAATRALSSFFDCDFSGNLTERQVFIEDVITTLEASIANVTGTTSEKLMFKYAIAGYKQGLRGFCLTMFINNEIKTSPLKLVV